MSLDFSKSVQELLFGCFQLSEKDHQGVKEMINGYKWHVEYGERVEGAVKKYGETL
jgi:hypothetical protein